MGIYSLPALGQVAFIHLLQVDLIITCGNAWVCVQVYGTQEHNVLHNRTYVIYADDGTGEFTCGSQCASMCEGNKESVPHH